MFPEIKVFVIEARTGCSCCSSENHHRGPYSTKEIAEAHAKRFHDEKLLASQWARNGVYHIEEQDGELLPDGRIISGSKIYEGFKDDGIDDRIEG